MCVGCGCGCVCVLFFYAFFCGLMFNDIIKFHKI